MVTLITGERDAGKSGEIVRLFRAAGSGDGVVSPKRFHTGRFLGYDMLRLSTGRRVAFVRPASRLPRGWRAGDAYGKYSFSAPALAEIQIALGQWLSDPSAEPLFLDEIGPLELGGGGFACALRSLLHAGRTLFVTVRPPLVGAVVSSFSIRHHRVVRCGDM